MHKKQIMKFAHFPHYWQIDYQAKGINHTRNFSVDSLTSSSSKAVSSFAELNAYKSNGGTIANLCSRTIRVRSHAESIKNAALRVQTDGDKISTFWINQADMDPAKLSPQKRTDAEALLKKLHTSHAMLLLEVENFLNLEKVGYLRKEYPSKVDW